MQVERLAMRVTAIFRCVSIRLLEQAGELGGCMVELSGTPAPAGTIGSLQLVCMTREVVRRFEVGADYELGLAPVEVSPAMDTAP